ncbi:hypothetical protein [Agrobacterium pusense]|uniref:hypothetical protein n=1 Tax=Agrobacterium pusense TaxID=648995 RepID=UPI0015733F81|nr:hypothetical protein [Agrobacterium pusense]NTE45751.1 hypothetical protein [Agrobacterium pusense]
MKNCLSNVAEIARNHDIFGPIDERISNPVQAVSDFYTAFSGNIGKLGFRGKTPALLQFRHLTKPVDTVESLSVAHGGTVVFVLSQVVNGTSPSYRV